MKIVPPDETSIGRFGWSVAIESNTIVVGDFHDDNEKGINAGAAYVYERGAGNSWMLVKKIIAGDGKGNENFGSSLAIFGDTLVVVAERVVTGNCPDLVYAYVFERNRGGNNNWGQVEKIVIGDLRRCPDLEPFVDIFDDTVVVATMANDAAYIFERNEGGKDKWGQTKRLSASDLTFRDNFGTSVAIFNDTVVVGADSFGRKSSGVYIFERDFGGENNWGQVKKLQANNGSDTDSFGRSVSILGDTIAVGSPYETNGISSVYVFERNGQGNDNWGQVERLTPSDMANDNYNGFGSKVAISYSTIVVGDENNNYETGAVYVFKRITKNPNSWREIKKLLASDGKFNDLFGDPVDLSNGAVVVGACCNIEAIYIYE